MKTPLLNYTTEIQVTRTVGEIEGILASHGAHKILKDYDGSGSVTAISFMVKTPNGFIPFRLPMNVKAVMQVINNQTGQFRTTRRSRERVVPMKFKNDMEQARRVGWRILKDWLEAQMALLDLQMVKIQEIFLPYTIGIDGKTLYERIESQGFKGYLLEKDEERVL